MRSTQVAPTEAFDIPPPMLYEDLPEVESEPYDEPYDEPEPEAPPVEPGDCYNGLIAQYAQPALNYMAAAAETDRVAMRAEAIIMIEQQQVIINLLSAMLDGLRRVTYEEEEITVGR